MRRDNEQLHEQTQARTGDNGPGIIPGESEGLRKASDKSKEESNATIVHARGRLLREQKLRTEVIDAIKSVIEQKSALQMEKSAFCSLKRSEVCNAPLSF